MKHVAIVLAAGKGSRMGIDTPKQFLEIEGHPVLYFSLKAFEDSFFDEIVVVTRKEDIDYLNKEIVEKYQFKKITCVVPGGKERSDSVFEGIKAVNADEETYVYIHDGARPCISETVLKKVRDDVIKYKAAVVSVPSKDTVKIIDEDGNVKLTPERKNVWSVQTPQVFEYKLIYGAFEKMMETENVSVTDDAMVVELFTSNKVHLTEGEYTNIKITTIDDLAVVKDFLKKIKKSC